MLPIDPMDAFFDLPWSIGGFIFTFSCVSAAILGLWYTKKKISPEVRKSHHDVAGFTFGIVGVIYAVLLGFIVVNVNERFNQIQTNLVQESAVMLQLYRDAEELPVENKSAIRNQIKQYALLVYGEEMEAQQTGRESRQAYDHLMNLWKEYYKVVPTNDVQKIWFMESVRRMNELADFRVMRLFNSTQSLGGMMWTLLFSGGVIVVLFMYFFHVENFLAHTLLTAFVTGTIAFMLYLVLSLDTAYSGDVRVNASEINTTLKRFDTI